MTFALIKNGQVAAYPYSLSTFRATNPDVSLPQDPTEAQLNEQGVYTVYPTNPPSYNPIYENLNEVSPTLQNGVWTQTWAVTPATPEEVAYREANARSENAAYGTALLQATDWTAIASIADPLECDPYLANRQEFLAYRNQVRIIVLNPPVEPPNWPVVPNEDWQQV
jgi:hypothetical protein